MLPAAVSHPIDLASPLRPAAAPRLSRCFTQSSVLRGGSRLNSDGPAKYSEPMSRGEADSEDSIDRLAEENALRLVGDAECGAESRE